MLSDKEEHLHGLDRIILFDLFFDTVSPGRHIRIIFLFEAVHPQCRRECKARIFKALFNGNTVSFPYITAAGAALYRHAASGAIERDSLCSQWQYAVIFQQDDTFCRNPASKGFMIPLPLGFFRCVCAQGLELFHNGTSHDITF